MPELIDKEATLKKMCELCGNRCEKLEDLDFVTYKCSNYRFLSEQSTIDAEPVRRGRWLSYTGTHWTGKENEYGDPEYKEHIFFVCSNCRRKTVVREHFCPKCGADMREVREDVVQT